MGIWGSSVSFWFFVARMFTERIYNAVVLFVISNHSLRSLSSLQGCGSSLHLDFTHSEINIGGFLPVSGRPQIFLSSRMELALRNVDIVLWHIIKKKNSET